MNEATEFNYHYKIEKCKTMDDVLGKNGLVQKLLKDVIQNLV